jgi:polyisoprenoid-binding protein YceI
MSSQWIRFGLILTGVMLLVAGCTPTQTAPPAATAIPSPAATLASSPTAASTTPPPAAALTTGGDSSSNSIRLVLIPDKSQASYRVREQLASLSFPSDAVGSTRDFSGTIVIQPDGTIVSSESKFVVNLETLTSDRSQRDNFIKRAVLQTSEYPTAVFVPTQVIGLTSPLPQSGDVAFKLIGDLTIRNVTKPVTWDVTGRIQSNELIGQATTAFTFDTFNLTQPRVPVVLSVENNIKLELNLDLQRQ